jgi:N-acyl-D-amino-acid deacylase
MHPHMRDETSRILDSVRETIRIREEGGFATQVTHHKIIGKNNWGKSVDTLRLIDEARAGGVDVTIESISLHRFQQWHGRFDSAMGAR